MWFGLLGFGLLVSLAFAALGAGAQDSNYTGAMKAVKPKMNERMVLAVAQQAATKAGFPLGDYRVPVAHFEQNPAIPGWTVLFEGKTATKGNHFVVFVDDRTGKAKVHPGE